MSGTLLQIFGIINIVGNFGTVFVDQGYWQSAIAARPSSSHKGYLVRHANTGLSHVHGRLLFCRLSLKSSGSARLISNACLNVSSTMYSLRTVPLSLRSPFLRGICVVLEDLASPPSKAASLLFLSGSIFRVGAPQPDSSLSCQSVTPIRVRLPAVGRPRLVRRALFSGLVSRPRRCCPGPPSDLLGS
jgi:hypothetical protein